MVVGNVPTKNLSGVYIDDGCHIPEPVDEPEICEVSCPYDVLTNGTHHFEDVRDVCFRPSQVIELHEREPSSEFWSEAMLAHETTNTLLVDLECHRDASVTVCGVLSHDGNDLRSKIFIGRCSFWFVVQA